MRPLPCHGDGQQLDWLSRDYSSPADSRRPVVDAVARPARHLPNAWT
ncbi:hypothetical protein AB0B78_24800 [Streptomyces sp. NPDC040724]